MSDRVVDITGPAPPRTAAKVTLTDEEAAEGLRILSDHFGQPVLPLRRVCDAFDQWVRAVRENNREMYDGALKGASSIRLSISKSGLLFRLLYRGESVRTEKCPYHKGSMSSGQWALGGEVPEGCKCDGSGWVPEAKAGK